MRRGKRVLRKQREVERKEALRRSAEFADNIAWLMHGIDPSDAWDEPENDGDDDAA